MVGAARDSGIAATALTLAGVRTAYNRSADAWTGGPEAVYDRLAEVLLASSPVPLEGARVLDVGAGTGAASRAALGAGARSVVAVDVAESMLRGLAGRIHPVLADASRLPFAAGSFDLVVAAYCLGHLPDPVAALLEARRVSPAIVASAFEAGWTHPAKAVVEEVIGRFGFRPPPWYVEFKRDVEPQVSDPGRLAEFAWAGGYRHVDVTVVAVPAGITTPAELVRWRLGMAHLAPFVQTLAPAERTRLRREAEAGLAGAPPLVVPMVVLAAH